MGRDVDCSGLGDLGLGVNLAQTLSQLRVLGQSLKKHPVDGEFTAKIEEINGIKVTPPPLFLCLSKIPLSKIMLLQ